jgi:hypothetical protein
MATLLNVGTPFPNASPLEEIEGAKKIGEESNITSVPLTRAPKRLALPLSRSGRGNLMLMSRALEEAATRNS